MIAAVAAMARILAAGPQARTVAIANAVAARVPRVAHRRPFSRPAPGGTLLGDNAGRFRRQTVQVPSDPLSTSAAPRPAPIAPQRDAAAPCTVAVVLCTYNGARYLPPQLDSLLAQQRLPQRIVIADDASSDATWPLLEAFAGRARARGIAVDLQRNPRNLGYLRNFESALRRADEDVVFLCDQDDVWYPHKIADYLREFETRPRLSLLHSDSRLIDGDGRELGQGMFQTLEVGAGELAAIHAGRAFEVLVRRNIVTGATAALRRELLARALPIPDVAAGRPRAGAEAAGSGHTGAVDGGSGEHPHEAAAGRPVAWIHDEWLALIAAATGELDCLEAPSIGYRQHGGNQIGARRRSLAERLGGGRQRREHMRAMVAKLGSLRDHLQRAGLDVGAAKRAAIDARIAHLRLRLDLPEQFARRWPLVREEWRQGRYLDYSAGLRSMVCDLLGLR